MRVCVTGAGGFIGGHLVDDLIKQGHDVVAVDKKPFREWFAINPKASSREADLNKIWDCFRAALWLALK